MRVWIAPLLLAASTLAVSESDPAFWKADLERMSPAELASAFLPAGMEANVVERRFWPGLYPNANYAGVSLITSPRRHAPGVCVRDVQSVSLTPAAGISDETLTLDAPVRADGIHRSLEIALSDNCASAEVFAGANSGTEEMAARLLRYAVALRDAARDGKPLGVHVECRSELTPNPCKQDIRAVVADLPVDKPRLINKL